MKMNAGKQERRVGGFTCVRMCGSRGGGAEKPMCSMEKDRLHTMRIVEACLWQCDRGQYILHRHQEGMGTMHPYITELATMNKMTTLVHTQADEASVKPLGWLTDATKIAEELGGIQTATIWKKVAGIGKGIKRQMGNDGALLLVCQLEETRDHPQDENGHCAA